MRHASHVGRKSLNPVNNFPGTTRISEQELFPAGEFGDLEAIFFRTGTKSAADSLYTFDFKVCSGLDLLDASGGRTVQ